MLTAALSAKWTFAGQCINDRFADYSVIETRIIGFTDGNVIGRVGGMGLTLGASGLAVAYGVISLLP